MSWVWQIKKTELSPQGLKKHLKYIILPLPLYLLSHHSALALAEK
jgi:hypothetical protein